MARKKAVIDNREAYYWQNLRHSDKTVAQMRAEYARMKDIVNKRYSRIKKALPKSQMAKKDYFQPLARGAKKRDVMSALSRVAAAYYDQWGSLTKQREQRAGNIDTMHRHGFSFVNEGNFDEFVDFMEEIRSRHLIEMFYSQEHGVDVYETANKAGVDPQKLLDDFEYFAKNYKDFEKTLKDVEDVEGMSSEEIKQYMQRIHKKDNKDK